MDVAADNDLSGPVVSADEKNEDSDIDMNGNKSDSHSDGAGSGDNASDAESNIEEAEERQSIADSDDDDMDAEEKGNSVDKSSPKSGDITKIETTLDETRKEDKAEKVVRNMGSESDADRSGSDSDEEQVRRRKPTRRSGSESEGSSGSRKIKVKRKRHVAVADSDSDEEDKQSVKSAASSRSNRSAKARSRSKSTSPVQKARSRSGSKSSSAKSRSRSRSGSASARSRSKSASRSRSRSGSRKSRSRSRSVSGRSRSSSRSRSRSGSRSRSHSKSRSRSRSKSRSVSRSRSRSKSRSRSRSKSHSRSRSKSRSRSRSKSRSRSRSKSRSRSRSKSRSRSRSRSHSRSRSPPGSAGEGISAKDEKQGSAETKPVEGAVLPAVSDSDDEINRDSEFVSDFELMLEKKKAERPKRKRRDVDIINDADDMIAHLLTQMRQAAEEDRELNKRQQPATHKMSLLSIIAAQLHKQDLQLAFLDQSVLSVICDWLAPMPDRSLPSLRIRQELLKVLAELSPNINSDMLKTSGVGKAVMYLYKHPKETRENREKAGRLISGWARPIFNVSTNYRNMTREDRLQRDLEQLPEKKRRISEDGNIQKQTRNINRALQAEEKALRPGDPGWVYRARVPMPSTTDYVNRPKWNTDTDISRNSKKAVTRYEKHIRNFTEQKRMKQPRRAVEISVQGRKMPL